MKEKALRETQLRTLWALHVARGAELRHETIIRTHSVFHARDGRNEESSGTTS